MSTYKPFTHEETEILNKIADGRTVVLNAGIDGQLYIHEGGVVMGSHLKNLPEIISNGSEFRDVIKFKDSTRYQKIMKKLFKWQKG
ncbi:hypothetical protein [Leuconostoc citreum]